MSASTINKAAAPRLVLCETSDSDQIAADHDALHVSRMFKKMYADLGLEEEFPGVFPVKTVGTQIFKKVIDWCKEHKDEPEPVVEKHPLTQECKWFEFTDYDKRFFDVPVSELLKLVMAASYLDIPRLYHYACQAVAARIKGKHPVEICNLLQQDCDLDSDRIEKIYTDSPWLPSVLSGARIMNATFIPNEVLVNIFEKLPREDLERLQLVSTQFDDVIVSSVELSAQQGPLRIVTMVEFGVYSHFRVSHGIEVWLGDGARVTCPDCESLAKRLKFAVVKNLRLGTASRWEESVYQADIEGLSVLLPVKSAWKNATVEAPLRSFPSSEAFEFVFTQLFLCKEVILGGERRESFRWSRPHMRLPGIAECNKLDIGGLTNFENGPADVVEWLEHEVPPEKKCVEPRKMVLYEYGINGGIGRLIAALTTAFSASSSRKPYIVRVLCFVHPGNLDVVHVNEQTQERLRIRTGHNNDVIVERT